MRRYFTGTGISISVFIGVLVAGVLWGVALTERGLERAVRQDFDAANLLADLQVEGEKMRRYEKEMFIYVAVPEKRREYVNEFDAAYVKLLSLMTTMLVPSSSAFSDEERVEMAKWKEAANFYAAQFDLLGQRASSTAMAILTTEQRLTLTVDYNTDITDAKNRFRILLDGTEKMRAAKKESSAAIASDMDAIFARLRHGVLIGSLVLVATVLIALRSRVRPATPVSPAFPPTR